MLSTNFEDHLEVQQMRKLIEVNAKDEPPMNVLALIKKKSVQRKHLHCKFVVRFM